jgi:hypothetical protein
MAAIARALFGIEIHAFNTRAKTGRPARFGVHGGILHDTIRRMSRSVFLGCLALWMLGCGTDGGPETPPPTTEPPDDDPQFIEPKCANPNELCLAAPKQGFQIQSVGTTIDAGDDIEWCEVVQLPGTPSDTYYVNAFESQMTLGSHHLIVAAIEPGTATDTAAEIGMRANCVGPDEFGGELLPVTGSQQPYHAELFPEGVGRIYTGGQKVVFDYHYFNTTGAPIQAKAAVNFHTVDASMVKKLSESFGFLNVGINIPAMSTAAFEAECTFSHDIMVHKLVRHTHRWGTNFDAWYLGGEHDGEHIFTSHNYEEVDFPLAEPVVMHAGEGFRFRCEFNNTESRTLTFGTKATDEMCILFGQWYVVNEGDVVPEQGCIKF